MNRTRLVLLGVVVALVASITALPAAAADQSTPALFQVGAAVADLTPPAGVAVYSGGFGQSPPIYGNQTLAGDPLNVRVIYVGNGTAAVEMAMVDSQGIFAAVQQASTDPKTTGLGSAGIRQDAAAAINAAHAGPSIAAADMIVQGSHSHSAPTAMGIWGPVPLVYLQFMHDRIVDAMLRAAKSARPAYLQWSSVDAPYLDNVTTNQTDSYAGWKQDGQVSVLRAVSANGGATIATYANVPAHPDIVNGAGQKLLSADYFGRVRAQIEQEVGGIGIVGGATLGREESPIQVGGVDQMRFYAAAVTELVTRALGSARWVTDPTVAGAETFMEVPGSNPLLLGLVMLWPAADKVGDQLSGAAAYPINRQNTPPYQTGDVLGSPVTALRIGRLAYVSLNGEAFPEVRHAIEKAVQDADMVVGLSLGNDQLGYYEPAFAWAFANGQAPYHSDHLEYNISPLLGDEVIQNQVANLRTLGFTAPQLAAPAPMDNDYTQILHPGVQGLASPARGSADAGTGLFTTTLEGFFGSASLMDSLGHGSGPGGPLHWDFQDGTTADTPIVDGRHTVRFTHAFRPGLYEVQITGRDASGDPASWTLEIAAYPPLRASASAQGSGSTRTYSGAAGGGSGRQIQWQWVFSDGTQAYGASVTHTFPAGVTPRARLVVIDATGEAAAASA